MDNNSLAHTTWECKYHIVFTPKFRRKIIYKQIKADVERILSELCKRKGIEIIEAEACPDHVHMFVRIPPKYSVSEVMLQIKDILMKSEELMASAKNNTEKDFEFAYFDNIDEALIEGLNQNQDFFSLLLQNDEIKKQVLGIFTEKIYKSLRESKPTKNTSSFYSEYDEDHPLGMVAENGYDEQ